MVSTFKYGKMDRRARRLTAVWLFVAVAILLAVTLLWGEGGYITAWAVSFASAVMLLYIMSVPRKIIVGDTALEIRCTVEITRIKYSELRSVRRIPPEAMHGRWVMLGSYGLFGYYGYYIDWRNWEPIKLYCKQWDNFIEITDVWEQRYIISSPAPDDVVSAITGAMRRYSQSAD